MITEQNITYITEENIAKLPARFVEQLCELSTYSQWGYPVIELGDRTEWLIVPDNEEDILLAVAQNIEESIEYFTPSFLASLTELPEAVFVAMQDSREAHEAILQILDKCNISMVDVAEEAIRWDGSGHFLSTYDGNKLETDDCEYALYRLN